jgi:PKD repeat protein/glucose/arabinose dehydrogenase
MGTVRTSSAARTVALVAGLLLSVGALAPPAAADPDAPITSPSPGPSAPATPTPTAERADQKADQKADRELQRQEARQPSEDGGTAEAADDPDLTKFQKVVLAQGTQLGEVMELTVADDGRVFFITRAGDIEMYDPADGSVRIVMNGPELGVWSGLEDGLLGITLDPDFADNGWIYVYYAPQPEDYRKNRLSRLTLATDGGEPHIHKDSEKVLLEVDTQRNICCHSAGSVQFDSTGLLYLATGDNTSSSDNGGFSPHDERPGRSDYDAQKSSANTNDLRGKILRIRPRDDDAGDVDPTPGDGVSYDIPDGNLFGEGGTYPTAKYPDAAAEQTRPEIYVMGLRNPYRLGLDPDTDVLYWGEVGPDSRTDSEVRGPRHQEEFNRTTEPMNGGWPYCGGEVGDDLTDYSHGGAYVDWDFVADTYRTNPDGSPRHFPCNDPEQMTGVNDSPNNTGLQDLPPMTDAWIPYSDTGTLKYPEVSGGTPIGGQVYRQSQNTAAEETAFPAHYEGSYFIAEMSRGWIKEVRMDPATGEIASINDFMSGFYAPGDMEFGPDGSLYVLEYGSGFFNGSPDTKLVRIDYAANGRAPEVEVTADPTEGDAPLTVQFDSSGTTDPDGDVLTWSWDFDNDGTEDSTDPAPSHTYDTAGDYTAVLTVTDATGKSATGQVQVTVGNTRPVLDIQLPVDGGFFSPGDDIDFRVEVTDAEEQVDCSEVTVSEGLGHDIHVHPNLSVNGCEGTMRTAESTDHGPDANTYGVLSATYTDSGANGGANAPLTGQDVIKLQPKLRQAEHADERQGVGSTGYDDKSGTRPGGGALITGMGAGDWVAFDPMSLAGMESVALTYSGSAGSGAVIELRTGTPAGPVAATVPLDGGTSGLYFYKTVSAAISAGVADVGGEPLYFVYTGQGQVNFDQMRFRGTGVASNTSPEITSATATPDDGAAPLEVAFAAEATDADGDALGYAWDFGVDGTDADTSDQQAPTWTYEEPGSYTATVTVTDSTGKDTSQAVPVTVRRPCTTTPTPDEGYTMLFNGRDLTGWQQAGPGGFVVEDCTMTSSGGMGLLWYADQQFADYSLKMQFKLADPGDNSGVFQRFPDPGNDPWVAVDEGHEIQIKEGQPDDEPQKTGSVYNFDREDARNANPIGEWNDYEIRVVGQTYTMTLNGVVVNEWTSDGSRGDTGFIGLQNHGNADSVTFRDIQVKELDVPEPFINDVTADPRSGPAPLTVTYTADGVDRQGDAITYEWDFGDGSPVVEGDATTTHEYTAGGSYTATATPVDAAGNRGEPVAAPEVRVLVDPEVRASGTPRCGLAPLAVDFTGTATDPQGQDVTWAWDFGVDGTDTDVSDQASPSYTYQEPGSYTARLTVTDPDGHTDEATVSIEALASGECRAVADLTPHLDNDGISQHANPGDGNFDNGGWVYAAETLPAAIRDAGGPIEIDGVDYEFPSTADGELNNVTARGQTIQLPSGRYDELRLLGSAANGSFQAPATITYTDGSTLTAPLGFSDWAVAPRYGEQVALPMPHRHDQNGDTGPAVSIFAQALAVDPDKDLATITLPDEPDMHVFAISATQEVVEPPCDMPKDDAFDDTSLEDNCNWRVTRKDESLYSVSDGALHLTGGPGEYATAPNIITQATPEGEWTVTSKLTFDPTDAGQQAGLVVAGAGGSGFAKLMFVDKGSDNEWLEFLKSSDAGNNFDFSGNWNSGGGSFDGPFLPADFPTTFWLRLSSDGTSLRGSYSTDGAEFTQVGDPRALEGITDPRVGVMAISDAPTADYDFFRWGADEPSEPRTWVVDAVDDAQGNRWESAEDGSSTVTIQPGDTVEWQFDEATMDHDLTSRSDNWSVSEFRSPGGEPFRHTFTEPGTYEYWCSIHGSTMTGTVVVEDPDGGDNSPPTVDPVVTPTDGSAPLLVSAAAGATDPDGDELTYAWDFGASDDGSDEATTARATYTYAAEGSYTARLTVSDGNGGTVERTFDITVGPRAMPEVTAGAEPASGEVPLDVQLTSQVPTSGEVAAYADGTETYPDVTGTVDMVRSLGSTSLTLDVTGLAPDAEHMVHVHEQPCAVDRGGAHFRFDASKPFGEDNEIWAPFTSDADGASGEVTVEQPLRAGPDAVSVVIHDPDDPAERIACADLTPDLHDLTYEWDFGDGTTGEGTDPVHTYTEEGAWTATLTVTAPTGETTTAEVDVTTTDSPETTITGGPQGTVKGRRAFRFTFTSDEPDSTFLCSVDGAEATACTSPLRVRVGGGSHTLEVTAVDADGNADPTPAVREWVVR